MDSVVSNNIIENLYLVNSYVLRLSDYVFA